jgi:hypothetical protein
MHSPVAYDAASEQSQTATSAHSSGRPSRPSGMAGRLPITTFAPSRAKASAAASPIPELPPVTSATLPS